MMESLTNQTRLPFKLNQTDSNGELNFQQSMSYIAVENNFIQFSSINYSNYVHQFSQLSYQQTLTDTQQDLNLCHGSNQRFYNNFNQNNRTTFQQPSVHSVQHSLLELNTFVSTQINQAFQSTINMKSLRNYFKRIYGKDVMNSIVTTEFTNIPRTSIYFNINLSFLPPKSVSPPWIYQVCVKDILECYPSCVQIYTDASMTPQGISGIAIVCGEHSFSFKIVSKCTTDIAEALAVEKALSYALDRNYEDFIILSDSLNTIIKIKNQNKSDSIIEKIVVLLKKHQKLKHSVRFLWIPGHCNILGNEIADTYARQAAKYK